MKCDCFESKDAFVIGISAETAHEAAFMVRAQLNGIKEVHFGTYVLDSEPVKSIVSIKKRKRTTTKVPFFDIRGTK